MKPRIVATAVLGSLIATLPAAADRRTKRRVADVEEEVDQDGPEAKAALTVKLDDLIEVAVRLSPALARSKNDRLTAKGQAAASRASQQWQVTTKASVERFSLGPDVEVGAFQVVATNKLSAQLGFGRNLPTGGNFEVNIGVQRELKEYEIPSGLGRLINADLEAKANAAEAQAAMLGLDDGVNIVDTTVLHQASATMKFTQPLAKGFGPDAALADQRKGDLAAAEATIRTQYEAELMVRDVVVAYWTLAYANFEVETRGEALALARKQDELTRLENRAGTKPQSEIDAVGYEIAIREESLLEAKNQYEKASLELRKKVGLELDRRDIVLRPVDKFEIEAYEWDIEDVLKASRKGNRRLAMAILQKRAADVDVKSTKNGMLPKVDLQVAGTVFGTGNTPDAAISGSASSAGFQVMGSLTVQFDIGGAAKGSHDAAVAKRQRVEIDQADTQRTIETEVVHAVHTVKSAQARVGFAERAMQLAENNVKAERANFQASKSDNFKVMQRQTELVNARLRRGKAISDYHAAVAELQFLGGMLLEQYRVSVRPLPRG